jgi:hypothetical protein
MQPPRVVLTAVVSLFAAASGVSSLEAQTITDGIMMGRRQLCTGFVYEHDQWSSYWEGTLKRDNGNIGTLTTQTLSWVGNYGVTDRVNLIAMVPHVWTTASAGTLQPQDGLQDLTFAIKVNALRFAEGAFKVIGVGTLGTPMADYNADFIPLSIGSASQRASGRLTLSYNGKSGLYLNGTSAYTWRGNVTLDRSSYYADGRLFYGDQVAMPDVFDYAISVGYVTRRLELPVTFSQQVTRGGGDIRRQDMPFVSNKMDVTRIDINALYYLPKLENLGLKFGVTRTLRGRNVGESTTLQGGLLYIFNF